MTNNVYIGEPYAEKDARHQRKLDAQAERELRVEQLQADLYEGLWAGLHRETMAVMLADEIGQEEAELIRRLVLANKDTDATARELYYLLETASTDYALRWAEHEVERENRDD